MTAAAAVGLAEVPRRRPFQLGNFIAVAILLAMPTIPPVDMASRELLSTGITGADSHIHGRSWARLPLRLFWSRLNLIQVQRSVDQIVAWRIQDWVAFLALPVGFALVALRLVAHSSRAWRRRAATLQARRQSDCLGVIRCEPFDRASDSSCDFAVHHWRVSARGRRGTTPDASVHRVSLQYRAGPRHCIRIHWLTPSGI